MNLSPAPRDRATIHAVRILVVEDDPDMSRFIVRGLGEQSYAVDAVANGREAIERGSSTAYDAIVLDAMILPPDGFESGSNTNNDPALANGHTGGGATQLMIS